MVRPTLKFIIDCEIRWKRENDNSHSHCSLILSYIFVHMQESRPRASWCYYLIIVTLVDWFSTITTTVTFISLSGSYRFARFFSIIFSVYVFFLNFLFLRSTKKKKLLFTNYYLFLFLTLTFNQSIKHYNCRNSRHSKQLTLLYLKEQQRKKN